MYNFFEYGEATVEFPEVGIILLTGENGEGKSALIEAVASAVYGKTMRGTPFWRAGEPCEVSVLTDAVVAKRRVTKGGAKALEWARVEDWNEPRGVRTFGTTSKAQAELNDVVPPLDVWRRTSVFSSHDAALFATATDATRKKLLEHILGIDRFDDALKRCRDDLRAAAGWAAAAAARLDRAEAVLVERRERFEEAKATLSTLPKKQHPGALKKKIATLAKEYAGRGEELTAAQDTLRESYALGNEGKAKATQLARALDLLVDESECPTCAQPVGEKVVGSIRASLDDAREHAEAERARRQTLVDDGEEAVEMKRAEVRAAREALKAAQDKLDDALAFDETRDRLQRTLEESLEDIEEGENEVELATEEAEEADAELLLLREVEKVLGLKGVRAQVTSRALAGLELVANRYLARLFDHPVSIALSSVKEFKTNDRTTDAITVEVLGIGNDLGYDATSGGQRRRLDVALLLGLANVAGAARVVFGGTTWFDEVFDALDSRGVEAVSSILRELGEERPVVVISHNAALVETLRPHAELRLHVEDHQITRAT